MVKNTLMCLLNMFVNMSCCSVIYNVLCVFKKSCIHIFKKYVVICEVVVSVVKRKRNKLLYESSVKLAAVFVFIATN